MQYSKLLVAKALVNDVHGDILSPPNHAVDQLWHLHMLDPVHYSEVCKKLFGEQKLLGHRMLGARNEIKENHRRALRLHRTALAMNLLVGEPPKKNEVQLADFAQEGFRGFELGKKKRKKRKKTVNSGCDSSDEDADDTDDDNVQAVKKKCGGTC